MNFNNSLFRYHYIKHKIRIYDQNTVSLFGNFRIAGNQTQHRIVR